MYYQNKLWLSSLYYYNLCCFTISYIPVSPWISWVKSHKILSPTCVFHHICLNSMILFMITLFSFSCLVFLISTWDKILYISKRFYINESDISFSCIYKPINFVSIYRIYQTSYTLVKKTIWNKGWYVIPFVDSRENV